MKHRVILTLDADQLRFLHLGLLAVNDRGHITAQENVEIERLRNVLSAAKEVCENRDRADEAERKLSQLAAGKVMQ